DAERRRADEGEVVERVGLDGDVVAGRLHDLGDVVDRGLVAGLTRVARGVPVGAGVGVRDLLEVDHVLPEIRGADAVDELGGRVVLTIRATVVVGRAGRARRQG